MNKPNFIFLFPDQWRGDCISAHGHPVVRTPFIDSLSYDGVSFTSAYSPAPTCIASRVSLLTGKTPSACGRLGYMDCVPWEYENTLIECLHNNGYQTINVGKTHFFPQRANLGFEINRLYDPQRHTDPEFESDYHIWLRNETKGRIRDTAHDFSNNTWVPLPWTYDEYLHPSNWTADTTIKELKSRDKNRPFFIQIGFHRPHPPYDPPWHYFARYQHRELPPVPIGDWAENNGRNPAEAHAGMDGYLAPDVQDDSRRAYYASCTHVDHQIGKIIYYLKQNKLYGNTCIIFASDHGEMLGDHYKRHKIVPFEGSARIPFIIKPPEAMEFAVGRCCKEAITLTDLMPTILEQGGITIPDSVEAVSVNTLLKDPSASLQRAYIHGEHAPCWQFVTDGN